MNLNFGGVIIPMKKQLNLTTLNEIQNKNKLTTTQLFGSFKTHNLYKYLHIIKTLQSKFQIFISNEDYNNSYLPYSESLKNYITTNLIPRPRYYFYRMKINKLYTLCNNNSKSLLHSIFLCLYYNFSPDQIINFFSEIIV